MIARLSLVFWQCTGASAPTGCRGGEPGEPTDDPFWAMAKRKCTSWCVSVQHLAVCFVLLYVL